MEIDFSYVLKVIDRISGAIPYTLLIIVISGSLGILLAAGIAAVRIKKWKVLSPLADVYVSFFRSTPPLIHIFLVYYGLPLILREFGINADEWSKTLYVSLALILFNGACMSEYLRPAYLAVEQGQHDAADSIGMTGFTKFRRIILPQMLPIAWPNLENAFVELVKDTSVLFVIGLTDIMGMAKKIISNDYGVKKLEVYLAAAAIYWCITFIVSKLCQLFEKKVILSNQTEKRVG